MIIVISSHQHPVDLRFDVGSNLCTGSKKGKYFISPQWRLSDCVRGFPASSPRADRSAELPCRDALLTPLKIDHLFQVAFNSQLPPITQSASILLQPNSLAPG